ncbi:MAG TPA: hypothetical protein VNM69_10875 [Bacillus sp. (in: firmicutes)]|jgi:hypothetical protein|nr:hypothetical protein [Bacillus sp. (in: firmicutes)]
MEKQKETKKEYSSPRLIELGDIVEITFGGKPGWGSDTYSQRYPRSDED